VLKWEKVHQTLSGLLNRHRFSLIRVNFPAPFFRRTKKKNVLILFSCRLLIIRERQVVCVLCPWVGMKFGTAEMRNWNPHSTSISTLSFLFLAFVEPVRAVERGGVSIDSSAQTTAADSIISLVSFTHTVYIYILLSVSIAAMEKMEGGGTHLYYYDEQTARCI
jgi:hypothetical protein